MLMTKYAFEVRPSQGRLGQDILLTRLADGAVKTFFLAGDRSPAPLESHMASLTDEQCDSFFPKQRK